MTTPTPLSSLLRSTTVLVVAVVCSALVVLSLIGALVFLLYYGKGTEPVTNLFSAANLIGLAALWSKVSGIEKNTNGTQGKLVDAVINAPAPATPPEGS